MIAFAVLPSLAFFVMKKPSDIFSIQYNNDLYVNSWKSICQKSKQARQARHFYKNDLYNSVNVRE